ncbi:MAG: hypothetical protein ACO3AY_05870 [Chitinophagaceae bacterium]
MAKLSDVQFALQGENPGVPQHRQHHDAPKPVLVDELKQAQANREVKYHIFKLVNNTRKGGVHVPGIDDVINPATGKMERVRLLSGVDTIWLKEQKDVTPEYARNNQRSLTFLRGTKILRIPEWDHTALEYARITKHNIGSPSNRTGSHFEFYEYNPAREQEEMLKREELEIEMAIIAKGMDAEKMRKHAAFLGLRLVDDLGMPKTDDGIRREYIVYAKRQPEYFQRTVESKEVEYSWLIKRAIIDAKIEIGREPGRVYWANGGGLIGSYAKSENPEKYLLDLALTNSEEGRIFKERLQQLG